MADRGIDRPIREARRPEGRLDGGRQQWADTGDATGSGIQPAQLAVVAKPAVHGVDILDDLADGRGRALEPINVSRQDVHRGA